SSCSSSSPDMITLIFGVLVLVLVLWTLQFFSKADPKLLIRGLKTGGGVAALLGAAFMAMRGQFALALPLGFAGLSMLGWLPFGPAGFGARTQKSTGQVSRVRSAFIEMELDHDTGAMRGRIVAGRHAGAELDALDLRTLLELLAEIDAESRALLAAYLDRRDPSWREHAQGDATAGAGRPPPS